MAVTLTLEALPGYPQSVGAKIESIFKVTLTGTYQTGGFLPGYGGSSSGFSGLEFVEGSYEYVSFNRFAVCRGQRIILHKRSDGAEVANLTDVTGDIYYIYVRGV